MPRLVSHGSSSSSRSSLALKLLLLGMGGCALLAAVYLPGRETADASGSMRGSDMRGSMGVSGLGRWWLCGGREEGDDDGACPSLMDTVIVPLPVLVCTIPRIEFITLASLACCRRRDGRGRGRTEVCRTLSTPSPPYCPCPSPPPLTR